MNHYQACFLNLAAVLLAPEIDGITKSFVTTHPPTETKKEGWRNCCVSWNRISYHSISFHLIFWWMNNTKTQRIGEGERESTSWAALSFRVSLFQLLFGIVNIYIYDSWASSVHSRKDSQQTVPLHCALNKCHWNKWIQHPGLCFFFVLLFTHFRAPNSICKTVERVSSRKRWSFCFHRARKGEKHKRIKKRYSIIYLIAFHFLLFIFFRDPVLDTLPVGQYPRLSFL